MGGYLVSEGTKNEIQELLRRRVGDTHHRGRGGSAPFMVIIRCDSDTPLDVSAGNIKEQLYEATIIGTSADFTYPTLEALSYELLGMPVLMTLLGDDVESVAPKELAVYHGVLLGDVALDAAGSLYGRPRVIVAKGGSLSSPLTTKGDIWVHNGTTDTRLPVGTDSYFLRADSSAATGLSYFNLAGLFGDVFSTSSSSADNAIARMDGTTGHTIQTSLVTIGDTGVVTSPAQFGFTSSATAAASGSLSYNALGGIHNMPGLSSGITNGGTSTVRATFSAHGWFDDSMGANIWLAQSFSQIAGVDTAKDTYVVAETGFGVGTLAPGTGLWTSIALGLTGTIGPGAAATGGVITNLGSGSFVSLTAANTWTAGQTINSTTAPALNLQQTSSDASDTLRIRNIAGTTIFNVTGAGNLTAVGISGSGVNFTHDDGTW